MRTINQREGNPARHRGDTSTFLSLDARYSNDAFLSFHRNWHSCAGCQFATSSFSMKNCNTGRQDHGLTEKCFQDEMKMKTASRWPVSKDLGHCSLPALSAFDHIQTTPFPVAPRLGSSFPKPRIRIGVEWVWRLIGGC